MAKTFVVGVGRSMRVNRYCPQCRKEVSQERILSNGVDCPRCGFFRWQDYKLYPKFIDIPDPEDLMEPENLSKTLGARLLTLRRLHTRTHMLLLPRA